jgi:uncharacterized protein YutE (UPF0331/DUF86 family)
VVLRAESIRARLGKLEEVLSHLEKLNRLTEEEIRGDFRNTWSVERGLQLGAEVLFDLGNHVLSAHFGVSAEDYEDILVQLERHGVLEAGLARQLEGLGGFRNLLVHAYLRIDPGQVIDNLRKAPEVFAGFAAALRAWLAGLEESSGY